MKQTGSKEVNNWARIREKDILATAFEASVVKYWCQ